MTQVKTERRTTETVQALWLEYHATGDKKLRDRLVLTLSPMVKYIVYRKIREVPARCEADDFISCGLEALMRSIDRYDPERGATLEQFAWTRIHGAVLDELRRGDWAPRSLRRFQRDFVTARERFIALNGRVPTRDDLSEALGISEDELNRRLEDIHRADVGSLNVYVAGEDESTIERVDTLRSSEAATDPESALAREQARHHLRQAFQDLPERERKIAVLLYVNNLTLREIGETLGVTESRVCQIHTQLCRRMRAALAEHDSLFAEVVG